MWHKFSVPLQFNYLDPDDLTGTLRRATDTERNAELTLLTGIYGGVEYYEQISDEDTED
ncbi:hypothetical protein AwEntero_28920 [Enterobacterales bacterium]|nr:hypothetical protein AwEntero_28920 [Enterobacterales bacterium]